MKSFVFPLALCAALGGCAAYVPAGYATYPAYPAYQTYPGYPAYPAYPAYGYAPLYGGPVFGFSYFGGGGGGFRHRDFHRGFRGGHDGRSMGAGPGHTHGGGGWQHDRR